MVATRWKVLLLCSSILFGTFYSYDIPAALNVPLEKYLDTPNYQYYLQLFYSFYSIPNVILPFFGGYLIDSFGDRLLLLVLSTLVALGHALFALGIHLKWYSFMLFGRLLFGVGGESLAVVQSQITSRWFRNKELAFALGWNICVGRLGSVFNDFLSPQLGSMWGVVGATWFGMVSCFFSLFCGILLSRFQEIPNSHVQEISKASTRHSSTVLWLLNAIILSIYATMIPFNTIHAAFLEYKYYPGDSIRSAQIMSIPDTMSALLVPFVGYFVDSFGHRCKTIIASALLLMVVHFAFYSTPAGSGNSPIPFLILLGMGYSLMTTVWSCIPLVVSSESTATAFGIATSVCNLSLALFPIIVARLVVLDGTYSLAELFFVSCAGVGLVCALVLLWWDQHAQVLETIRPNTPIYESLHLEDLGKID
jgi:MFS family permease